MERKRIKFGNKNERNDEEVKVLIATKNQGKIEGAKKALEHYFKDIEIKGIPVESDVPEPHG